MGDERLEVLRMVGEKKITVEEAERLLKALDEREQRRESSGPRPEWKAGLFGLGENLRGIGELIRSTVEEAVGGIGFGFEEEFGGLEEVPTVDGRFEVPEGTTLLIKKRSHGN